MIIYRCMIIFIFILLFNYSQNEENILQTSDEIKKEGDDVVLKIEGMHTKQDSTAQYSFLSYILNNFTTISPLTSPVNNSSHEEQIKQVICLKNMGNDSIEIVNRTSLVKLLEPLGNHSSIDQAGRCFALFFYASWCPFSALAAPHFNALSRAFPDIKMAAVDATLYHSFNTQYGIVGLPTLLLFHQGRPIAKFNHTEYIVDNFVKFLTKYTKLEPVEGYYISLADFNGPLSSIPQEESDYCLILAWGFIFICAVYYFMKSTYWKLIIEMIKKNWRESEAQHDHNE